MYKVKTYKEITKLERNGMFVYESVPGTSVFHLQQDGTAMSFEVQGFEDSQITVELEAETEYQVLDVYKRQVDIVISNNASAYALERARKHDIEAVCIAPKDYPDREAFHKALLAKLQEKEVDLIVLAGYLVAIPPMMVEAYPNKIINIHPSLIPSFCGKGFYGLKVHDAVLARGVKVTGATVHFVDAGTDTGCLLYTSTDG